MKRFMKWTIGIAAVGVGTAAAVRALQAGRAKLKHAIGEAEAVTDRTRAALEQTETALRDARTSI
jgi:hypothetical protein